MQFKQLARQFIYKLIKIKVVKMHKIMKVVQCWDDGVTTDIKLIEILRRYNAKATFNLNAGLFEKTRGGNSWEYKGTEVQHLGWSCGKI
jgi:peptidoglycan/xylan/chitin deacetylase (PgdA/CDA1 family)